MKEENEVSYYAIIPANVRYDNDLNEKAKLLYGEITCLSNKEGYCYASNNYFARLYKCSIRTIQNAISKLQEKGYITVVIENSNERKIYIRDGTHENFFMGRYEKNCIGGYENFFTHNNININNIKLNIDDDDLFNLIVAEDFKIPIEFYKILERLDLKYNESSLSIINKDNLKMIKDIIYVLYELYNSKLGFLLYKVSRESLFSLYYLSLEHSPDDLLSYYKKAIINKYTK